MILILMGSIKVESVFAEDLFELGAGPAIIEEGDDRMRPGIATHLGVGKDYFFRFYSWGRKFGPVKETSYMLAAARKFPVFSSTWAFAHFGVAALSEKTEIKFSDDTTQNDTENNTNIGGVAGLHLTVDAISPILLQFSWDSHLYLAGPNGAIFLANSRKQTISLVLGLRL